MSVKLNRLEVTKQSQFDSDIHSSVRTSGPKPRFPIRVTILTFSFLAMFIMSVLSLRIFHICPSSNQSTLVDLAPMSIK